MHINSESVRANWAAAPRCVREPYDRFCHDPHEIRWGLGLVKALVKYLVAVQAPEALAHGNHDVRKALKPLLRFDGRPTLNLWIRASGVLAERVMRADGCLSRPAARWLIGEDLRPTPILARLEEIPGERAEYAHAAVEIDVTSPEAKETYVGQTLPILEALVCHADFFRALPIFVLSERMGGFRVRRLAGGPDRPVDVDRRWWSVSEPVLLGEDDRVVSLAPFLSGEARRALPELRLLSDLRSSRVCFDEPTGEGTFEPTEAWCRQWRLEGGLKSPGAPKRVTGLFDAVREVFLAPPDEPAVPTVVRSWDPDPGDRAGIHAALCFGRGGDVSAQEVEQLIQRPPTEIAMLPRIDAIAPARVERHLQVEFEALRSLMLGPSLDYETWLTGMADPRRAERFKLDPRVLVVGAGAAVGAALGQAASRILGGRSGGRATAAGAVMGGGLALLGHLLAGPERMDREDAEERIHRYLGALLQRPQREQLRAVRGVLSGLLAVTSESERRVLYTARGAGLSLVHTARAVDGGVAVGQPAVAVPLMSALVEDVQEAWCRAGLMARAGVVRTDDRGAMFGLDAGGQVTAVAVVQDALPFNAPRMGGWRRGVNPVLPSGVPVGVTDGCQWRWFG